MSLLSVTVKKAQFVGAHAAVQGNSYVTLKLQNVKSTTVTVKGANPSWEQDFLFEVNNLDAGLLIEVWNKGLIWDKAAGYHWLYLREIPHSNVEGCGQWLPLEAELVMRDGEVVGTKTATGHAILIDARFELPYANDLEGEEAVELQRKLEMLNSMLDQEARAEQARKQHQYYIQSGVSEDSDYTSDINYPIGQHPNSSASQFLSVANQLNTPQRSLNSSRENSYEKEDDYYRTNGPQHSSYYPPYPKHRKQLPNIPNPQQPRVLSSRSSSQQRYWDEPRDSETDPLYYNSRPQSNYKSYSSYRRRNSWDDEYNQKRPEDTQAPPLQYEEEDYEDAQEYSQPQHNYAKRLKNNRRGTPSLERQYTLYEDASGDYLEEEVEDADRRSKPYANEPYSTYNKQNAHKDSVYDQYNQQYSDYVQDETAYDDRYIDYQSEVITGQDQYAKEDSYQQYDGWSNEQEPRDQYTTPSSKKYGKELPQVPIQYHRQSQPQSLTESPFASQSTVKEASVSTSAVPSLIATHHEAPVPGVTVPSISTAAEVINSGGYGNLNADGSFYDETNYNNHALVDHSSSVGRVDAVVPTTMAPNDPCEQYMDAYENPEGYEDWQNYGYYDEAGNYVQYDPNSYYDESGNLIPGDVQSTQTHEKDTYGYYDETSTSYKGQSQAADTTVTIPISAHPIITTAESYDQYEDASYYNTTETDLQYPKYDELTDPADYTSYPQDEFWYDDTDTTAFDHKKSDPSHPELDHPINNSKVRPHLGSQSSVEYNYAYQSAENLSLFDNSAQKMEKSEPISRRASFRRQASTRDYGGADAVPLGQIYSDKDAYSSHIVVTTVPTTTTTTTTTSSAAATAANAANKITSEIKSALPGLTSFTKGKTDLFSSSFSKLGSFVSSAAAKTGVTVPLINKEKETPIVQPVPVTKIVPPIASMDQGLGHSLDETQYNQFDHWNGQYDEDPVGEYHEYVEGRTDSFDHYEAAEEGKNGLGNGPVHMDSLESNVSEGVKDADANDLEAEYWQKQRERIAKQASLTAQDSQDYYNYDPYGENKPPVLPTIDSTDERNFNHEHDEFNRQESLDREEWLRELEKQSGGQIRPSLNKKDTMSISLDRSESIDRQTDYGDEYGTDQEHERVTGQDSLESGDAAYPTSPPPLPKTGEDVMQETGRRKSSLEILQLGKEKGNKTVSFEEEPPKAVPERQTKGMTPREKWMWAINRICAQLAVRIF